MLTPEIQKKLDSFKGKDIHIDLTRLSFNKSNMEIQQQEGEDEISVIKQFINKTDNSDEQKELLLQEGIKLIDRAKI